MRRRKLKIWLLNIHYWGDTSIRNIETTNTRSFSEIWILNANTFQWKMKSELIIFYSQITPSIAGQHDDTFFFLLTEVWGDDRNPLKVLNYFASTGNFPNGFFCRRRYSPLDRFSEQRSPVILATSLRIIEQNSTNARRAKQKNEYTSIELYCFLNKLHSADALSECVFLFWRNNGKKELSIQTRKRRKLLEAHADRHSLVHSVSNNSSISRGDSDDGEWRWMVGWGRIGAKQKWKKKKPTKMNWCK